MSIRSIALSSLLIIACSFILRQPAAQTIPQPGESFSSITNNGVWTWYGNPKAVYYAGIHKRTYIAWTSNTTNQYLGYYDHDTKTTSLVLLPWHYPADDHNHPSVIVRPDGRVMTFQTGHDGTQISECISKQPEDISALDTFTVKILAWSCYPNICFLKNEGTIGRYYLFFRDLNQEPWFRTSDDWGVTWGTEMHLYTNNPAGYKPYFTCASNGIDEIHIDVERENRAIGGTVPTYYMKYKNGAFYQASGKLIATMAQLPIVNTVLDTVIYPGAYGAGGTVWDIAYDKNDNPVILYDMFFSNNAIHVYWYLRWTGSYWFKRPLVNSGANDGVSGQQFCGGITFDHENPNVIYMSRQAVKSSATPFNLADTSFANYKKISTSNFITVDSDFELDKWTTADSGLTWDSVAITRGSAAKNLRPCVPRDHLDGMNVNLVWLDGTMTSMSGDGYSMSVRMYPTDKVVPALSMPRNVSAGRGLGVSGSRIVFSLAKPALSSLRIYSLDGALVADFSSDLRRMSTGPASLSTLRIPAGCGAYAVVLDNGESLQKTSIVLTR